LDVDHCCALQVSSFFLESTSHWYVYCFEVIYPANQNNFNVSILYSEVYQIHCSLMVNWKFGVFLYVLSP
ncbi:hypothetical protein KC19_VG064600, partial [Ceratodon purpureus]